MYKLLNTQFVYFWEYHISLDDIYEILNTEFVYC